MKTLCVVLALTCALAGVAQGERRDGGARLRMPFMPTVEEQRQALVEAANNPDPLRRLPFPAGSLRRDQLPGGAAAFAPKRLVAKKSPAPAPAQKLQREPQPDFAGRPVVQRNSSLRIINGDKAVLGQFPWQAGVLGVFNSGGKMWCGGSIVHSLWILSAAHCVDDGADYYSISVGSLGSEAGSEPSRQVLVTEEYYQHPEYNPYFIDNDVSLIKLPSHITFNAWCRPVRLPSYSMATDMMTGTTGTVSGWGKSTDSDSWITKDLMYIDNTIDDGSACYKTYANAWIPNKVCVQTLDGKSFCSGDSGGAFTFEEEPGVHTQLGIVSYGTKYCEQKMPVVYTRVATFLDFIEDTTNIAIRD